MPVPRWWVYLFVVISILGFLDATFLAVKHISGGVIPCTITAGCEKVTTSSYATVAGIPVALLGALYYFSIFFLSLVYLSSGKPILFKLFTRSSIIGVVASFWFVYVQLFILHALCIYCLFSAATSTALFILALLMVRVSRANQRSMDMS